MVEIIVAIITGIVTITIGVLNFITNKKNVKKDDLIKVIQNVEKENCKNYLVQSIAKLESGQQLTPVEKERYWENYDRYTELGGNSYVHTATERLKEEGKL